MLMNVSHPSLSKTLFSDNALSYIMAAFIINTRRRGYWSPVNKLAFFYLPSTVWPLCTHLPGGGGRKIEIII